MNSKLTRNHPEYQYLDLLREIYNDGVEYEDRGTWVKLRGVFGRQTRYDLSKGFPLLTTKRVYWKGVLHELYWFMSGQSNIKYLVDNDVHIWDDYPLRLYNEYYVEKGKAEKLTKDEFIQKIKNDPKFAKKYGNLPKIYGELWRRWPTRNGRTIDQLKWVIQELKDDPGAKNLIVTSWNPEYLYTMATHKDASRFPICHNMYQVNVKGNRLSLQLYQRSADIFLGVPFNIASYALLAIILARITGYEPGEFVHTFGDVHIYENHMEQVKEQLTRVPRPFPIVKIDPSVKTLEDFRPELVTLENYDPYPTLKGDLTVTGGIYNKKKRGYFDEKNDQIKRTPTVGIVILDGNNVLLVKHGEKAGHITGTIGTPGGRIDAGETAIQAAIRELEEETGIQVHASDLEQIPHVYYGDLPRKDGSILYTDHKVFVGNKFKGKLKGSEETMPVWMTIDDVLSMKMSELLPNIQDMIQRAVELLKK